MSYSTLHCSISIPTITDLATLTTPFPSTASDAMGVTVAWSDNVDRPACFRMVTGIQGGTDDGPELWNNTLSVNQSDGSSSPEHSPNPVVVYGIIPVTDALAFPTADKRLWVPLTVTGTVHWASTSGIPGYGAAGIAIGGSKSPQLYKLGTGSGGSHIGEAFVRLRYGNNNTSAPDAYSEASGFTGLTPGSGPFSFAEPMTVTRDSVGYQNLYISTEPLFTSIVAGLNWASDDIAPGPQSEIFTEQWLADSSHVDPLIYPASYVTYAGSTAGGQRVGVDTLSITADLLLWNFDSSLYTVTFPVTAVDLGYDPDGPYVNPNDANGRKGKQRTRFS